MALSSVVIQFEALTSEAQARIGAFGQAIDRLERPTTAARLGVRQMRTAVEELGFQALGATGPVGRLGATIANLFGTSIFVGVLAGAAALGGALALMESHAKAVTERLNEMAEGAKTARIPMEALAKGIQESIASTPQAQLTEAQNWLARFRAERTGFQVSAQLGLGAITGTAPTGLNAAIEQQEIEVGSLTRQLALFRQHVTDAAQAFANLAAAAGQQVPTVRTDRWPGQIAPPAFSPSIATLAAQVVNLIASQAAFRVGFPARVIAEPTADRGPGIGGVISGPSAGLTARTALQLGTFLGPYGQAQGLAAKDPNVRNVVKASEEFKAAASVAIASFGAMAQAAIEGSHLTAQSVIGMISNIIQSIPGVGNLAGSIIGAGLGIVGALFGRHPQAEPVPVYDAHVEQAIKQTTQRPIYATINLLDASGRPIRQVKQQIDRLSRLDAVDRFGSGNVTLAGAG